MWFPGGSIRANYPNFSHGTSGVAYFLATLYQRTKEKAFLDGALAGVKYLDAVATRRNGARAIFHVTGGGEDRFYLCWCHGPSARRGCSIACSRSPATSSGAHGSTS